MKTATTKNKQHIKASRAEVYRALLDPAAVQQWQVPDGMTSEIHIFEARAGGLYRISLTYEDQSLAGKTSTHTDTHHGEFVELVPDRKIVQISEFETTDPTLRGEMKITIELSDAKGGGTDLVAIHEGVPSGVAPKDNEMGWAISLKKLAALVETRA